MCHKISQLFRLPALLLAAALQVMPIVRVALPATQATADVLAIVFRWGAAVAAALGGIQAVSGASTVITNPLSTNIVEGVPFTMRLTTAPNQATYWTASSLPTGINLVGTSGSSLWQLSGTPTVSGTFNVGLTAYESKGSSLNTSSTLVINISPAVSGTAPAITVQPSSLTVTQGQSAAFSVTATGTAPLTYFWFKGATVMTNGPNASLSVSNVQPTNAGTYSVIVSNSVGTITSSNATLRVIVPPTAPSITTQPASQLVNIGQAATFDVVAAGSPPLSYIWLKGATVLTNSTNPAFTIANTQPADAGTYSVVVSNNIGTAISSNATLTVNTVILAPGIVTQPTNQWVYQGVNASFVVVASGTAPFGFQWLKNGLPLADSTHLSGSQTNILTINNVATGDDGGYSVVITNYSGAVTSQVAMLTVTNATIWTISVQIVGNGTVSPNYNGQALVIGSNYTMTASAASGSMFSKWTGGIYSTAPTLNFVMQRALALQANFIPSPFIPLAGTYHGLFYDTNGLTQLGSGGITLNLAASAAFTGNVQIGKSKWNFTGQFDVNGNAAVTVNRGSMLPLALSLQLDLTGSSDELLGTVTVSDNSWTSELSAERSGMFDARTNPCPMAGAYTLLIPGTPGATQSPAGDGFGIVKVTAGGIAALTGMLADGTAFSTSGPLSPTGEWALFAPLYAGRGCLLGWLTISNTPTVDITGSVSWFRPVQPSVALYTMGFSTTAGVIGSRYTPPTASAPILNFTDGMVVLSDGNLPASFTNQILLGANNRVTNLSGNSLQLSFSTASGLFTGKATDPATGRSVSYKGIVLQKPNVGGGFFLNQHQSGEVYLEGTASGGGGGGNGGGTGGGGGGGDGGGGD